MAQDDMHVLIYKALAYLYDCMKRGKEPDKAMLSCTGLLFGGIPERYWTSVWIQMLDKGLVSLITSQNVTAPKPTLVWTPPVAGLITSQNVTAPKRARRRRRRRLV